MTCQLKTPMARNRQRADNQKDTLFVSVVNKYYSVVTISDLTMALFFLSLNNNRSMPFWDTAEDFVATWATTSSLGLRIPSGRHLQGFSDKRQSVRLTRNHICLVKTCLLI